MGLPNWLHWSAWFLKAIISTGLSCALLLVLVKIKIAGGRSILTETDSSLIFAVLMANAFTVIGFCFFMSTLFSSANTAATAAGFIWVVNYIPYAFYFPRINMTNRVMKYLSCFLVANIPVSYASYIIAMFEGTGEGLQWENIMEGLNPDDSFCLFDCFVMMFVNGGVCMVAGFYIELVWPGKYGVPLPWYFPLTKWYWLDGIQQEFSQERTDQGPRNEFFEADPVHLRPGIDIRGLRKVFGSNVAVKNLDIVFYENQVAALLGHNGAGKTTTMSMLTGLVTPTSGTALVNGFDIRKDMLAVRGSLGICPQYNVLFDDLTVEEHIKFFSLLKGYSASQADEEVDRMVRILGFESKRHALAHTLSGGMKRKLSIGIAFCAGSKAVLLDEPTSGMDPRTRRSTWDLIQSEKFGRTVILSTHFMEEADLLGDRIAIMSEGNVKCCGRSLFLKKKYGGDHQLIVVKNSDCDPGVVLKFLQNNIPSVRVKDDVGSELSYFLPADHSGKFSTLFEDLEKQKNDLGILSFGVGNTTMEEVFMRVGELDQKSKEASLRNQDEHCTIKIQNGSNGNTKTKNGLDLDSPETPMLTSSFERDGPRNEGLSLMWHQLKALVFKKAMFVLRNHGLLSLQIVIPVFAVVLCMLCFKNIPGLSTPASFRATLDHYENVGHTVTLTKCDPNHKVCEGYRNFVSSKHQLENFQNGSLENIYLEKATVNVRHADSKFMIGMEQTSKNANGLQTGSSNFVGFFNNQPFHNPPIALNYLSNGFLRSFGLEKEISTLNHPFDYSDVDNIKQAGNIFTFGFLAGWVIEIILGVMGGAFCVFPIYERTIGAKHLQYVAGVTAPIYWASSFIIDIVNYMIPCVLIVLSLALMNIKQFHEIEVIVWFLTLCLAHGWCMIAMMALFSFMFTIPASGFSRMTLFNSGSGIAAMVIVIAMENPELGLGELAATLHNIFIFLPNYALGMGIIQISIHNDLKDLCGPFDLDTMCKLDKDFVCCRKYQENYYSWEEAGLGKNFISLIGFGILFYFGVFCIENNLGSKIRDLLTCRNSRSSGPVSLSTEDEDSYDADVLQESERISSQSLTDLFKTDNLVLRNVRKTYNEEVTAVRNLSLGVPKGEIFGLLGVNGAGKTTTFKMITGDISVTSGDIYLCKNSVRRNISEVYKKLGYCPQFDALIEQITGRETLRLFATLKGIQEDHIDRIINNLSESLLFTKHIDKQVLEYSGGNKRKLSTAVAMLGNPAVVFLDEPTTGLDPVARRQLWNAVNRLKESGTSVVITSHSMEECEALCSRLGIMVDGGFQCLGSPQHLKNKFGEGYSIVAQLNYTSNDTEKFYSDDGSIVTPQWEVELQGLKDFLKKHFPDCELKDAHPGFVQYYVPGRNTKWADLFAVMERAKEEFNLDAYSVGQTSLEQVFFNFTTQSKSFEE
ncbi:unnamed protein product [Allacma fusca]|uniref:ABC transporter domain-containing protein n=1 Tax=Allacma fusca TaxID=39272 RepID=A0A8J2L032_9HEXA|nr:unnamed protein product [Allacma fusca]